MVPNSVVLNVAVVPLREPDGRRPAGPAAAGDHAARRRRSMLQRDDRDADARRRRITLEELDGDEVVVRIRPRPNGPATARDSRAKCSPRSRS